MSNAIFTPPAPHNEPVLSYAPGSPERKALQTEYDRRTKNIPPTAKPPLMA